MDDCSIDYRLLSRMYRQQSAASFEVVDVAPGVVRVLLAYGVHQKACEYHVHDLHNSAAPQVHHMFIPKTF